MKIHLGLMLLVAGSLAGTAPAQVRVIAIGAHPDDCDLEAGGTAQLLEARGIKVKFVSITNGDAGHPTQGGGALGSRRRAEAIEAGKRIGVEEYEVLDHHDGELMPSLEIRHELIRIIRRWKADAVISHRTNDYYCDHRYAGQLVTDTSLQVVVPNICPDTPPLERNPVYLYFRDEFQQPNPFRPDIAISIDEVYQKKIFGLDAHVSQFYEWLPWLYRYTGDVPKTSDARLAWLAKTQSEPITPAMRSALEHWYGAEKASHVVHAEAFEVSEYGTKPTEADLRQLFPMMK